MAPTGVPGVWARNSSLMLTDLLEGRTVPDHFAESRTVFITKTFLTSMTMEGLFDHQTHFVH